MGYFTHFEQGNRTDAVIKDNSQNDIAHIEWEWHQVFLENVNEIKKLYEIMQYTGGGAPNDDILEGVFQLINFRYATMKIVCVVGLDKHSHGDFKDS